MDVLTYFLKSSVILTIFYTVYFLFMRKDTLFTAKRFYFITGLISAITLPFLNITKMVYIESPTKESLPIASFSTEPNAELQALIPAPETFTIDWLQVLLVIYIIGVAFLVIRFLTQFFSLLILFKKSPAVLKNGFSYIEVTDSVSPFSFFNFIVYNPALHTQAELQMIMAHEQIHGTQYHTLDIFLSQLVTIIQWANPISWGYKKAVEANLEFVADAHTIPKIESKKQYQLTLVKASSSLSAPALTSPFYQSLIKKRIIMLNKTTSRKHNLLKTAIVLPLLAFFMLSFNVIEKIEYKEAVTVNSESLIITSEMLDSEITAIKNTINQNTTAFKVDFVDAKRDVSGKLTQLVIATKFSEQSRYIKNVTYGGSGTVLNAIKLSVIEDQLQFSDLEEVTVMRATATGVKALKFPKKKTTPKNNMGLGENPLYIINGINYRKKELKNPASFTVSESITVYDPVKGQEKYGAIGADGVLIFNGVTTVELNRINPSKRNTKIINNENLIAGQIQNTKDVKNYNNKQQIQEMFKYLITKNTTDVEFEKIKKELKEMHNTIFTYSVTRNNSNEIIALAMSHSDSKGNNGNYSISDSSPILDATFYKTETGFGFGQIRDFKKLKSTMNRQHSIHSDQKERFEKRRHLLEEKTEKMQEKRKHLLEERTEKLQEIQEEMEERRNMARNMKRSAIRNSNVISSTTSGRHPMSNSISNHNHQEVYITKNTTDADLANIKTELAAKGMTVDFKRVKRNSRGEINRIKINVNDNKGNKQVISKQMDNDTAIEDILIEL